MMHAVLRPRQASQGRLLRLLQVLAPPNSDRIRNAGPDMGCSSLGNGEAIEAQITQFYMQSATSSGKGKCQPG
jgi:hypothetical protein